MVGSENQSVYGSKLFGNHKRQDELEASTEKQQKLSISEAKH